MAKSSSAKTGGTSRIRFVMVDAEIAEGEIGPITQAIQNALRGPAPATFPRLPSPAAKTVPQDGNGAHQAEPELESGQDDEVVDAGAEEPRQPRVRRTVSRTPKVVDIDMNEAVSLASFAESLSKNIKRDCRVFGA